MTTLDITKIAMDFLMSIWIILLIVVLQYGRSISDEEVMFGAVAMATVSVFVYTIFRF